MFWRKYSLHGRLCPDTIVWLHIIYFSLLHQYLVILPSAFLTSFILFFILEHSLERYLLLIPFHNFLTLLFTSSRDLVGSFSSFLFNSPKQFSTGLRLYDFPGNIIALMLPHSWWVEASWQDSIPRLRHLPQRAHYGPEATPTKKKYRKIRK